jgi:hypothetical protein
VERRALPDVHAQHLRRSFRRRVGRVDRERDQQVEALLAPVIPELGSPDGRARLEQGHVAIPAPVGHVDPSRKRQQAHLLPGAQRIVATEIVGEGRGHIVGRLVQPADRAAWCSPGGVPRRS